MVRDLVRGIMRMLLLLFIMASCVETFYFMGELSRNPSDRYKRDYNNYPYTRSSTRVNNIDQDDEIEDVSEIEELPNENDELPNGYYY